MPAQPLPIPTFKYGAGTYYGRGGQYASSIVFCTTPLSGLSGLFNYDPNYIPRNPSARRYSDYVIQINWEQPILSGLISGYRIYRSEAFDSQMSPIGSTTGLNYIDSGLSEKNYYYRIVSVY